MRGRCRPGAAKTPNPRDALPFCHLTLKAAKPKNSVYPCELNTLGAHIRAARLIRRWLQKDLAKHLGVESETVWRWKCNESSPTVRYVPKIIQLLGYNPFPDDPDSLREKITLTRKLLGLTQEAMARRLGMDETTLRCFERESQRASRTVEQAIRVFLTADHNSNSL